MSEVIVNTFKQVLNEVSPSVCVQKALKIKNNKLIVNSREYELKRNVRIVAAGKAAVDMVVGAENALGQELRDGIASVPIGSRIPSSLKTRFYEAAEHNLPDQLAIQSTNKIFEFLEKGSKDEIVLFLISGGASALLCLPTDGVSLEDKLKVIKLLASNGADITELNTVRISLSKVKGGKLAQRAAPSKAISLIISDIVGTKIDKVGSGPTVQQTSDLSKVKQILEKRGVWNQVPESVKSFLNNPTKEKEFNQQVEIDNVLLCDNQLLLNCIKKSFEAQGIETAIVNAELEGNASEVGEQMAGSILEWIRGKELSGPPFNSNAIQVSKTKRFSWIYGGETTVRFPLNLNHPNPKGGRNQEMVLAVFNKLYKQLSAIKCQPNMHFYFASLGSDGQDGPTDATGAIISSDDLNNSDEIVDKIEEYLDNKNSYAFWSNFKNGERLVKTGKTGNNLMDLQLILFEEK